MNILQIGQDIVIQKDSQDQSYPQVSQDTPYADNGDTIKVDKGLSKKDNQSLYDRTGNLIGAKNPPDENQFPGEKKKAGNEEKELTETEVRVVEKLKERDRSVRAHEMAHMAVGGSMVSGGAHYQYEVGPDGNAYAVGGEVSIAVSGGNTPEQTVQKMQQVEAAALAPVDPSPQDRAVAAEAAQRAQAARAEMAIEATAGRSTPLDNTMHKADSSKQTQPQKGYHEASGPGGSTKQFHIII
jgi:hypothetical protein